jgi:hypothetical protein
MNGNSPTDPPIKAVDTVAPEEDNGPTEPIIVGRYGSFFFIPEEGQSPIDASAALLDTLQNDGCISTVHPNESDDKADRLDWVAPHIADDDSPAL